MDEHTGSGDLDETRVEPTGPTTSTGSSNDHRLHIGPTISRGDQIGRYLIIDTLGVGGMGEVFSAYDPQLDRRIALKLVKFAPNEDAHSARDRLLREAQALAKLSHPNVVAVYDAGTHGAKVFIAMEFVEGHTMREWITEAAGRVEEPGRWRVALDLMMQAGRGLAAAHKEGLVHRDFKPANIMVDDDDRVRVLDFGLARRFGEQDPERRPEPEHEHEHERRASGEHVVESLDGVSSSRGSLSMQLTQTGMVMGTPSYMAPEQFFGGFIDERADQFSFCVVLFRAMFGIRPFAGETFADLGRTVSRGEVREIPKGIKVPPSIQAAVLKGLSVTRDARHANMDALLDALEHGTQQSQRRVQWIIGGAMLAAAAVGVAAVGTSETGRAEPCTGAEARLEGIWDDGTRTAMASAFSATELPYAEDARAATERSLDDYTERWIELHTEICKATRVRRAQSEVLMDLRIGCLDHRLRTVGALTQLLAEADIDVVKNSAQGVQQLPNLDECSTVERDDSSLMRPEDPQVAEKVEQIRTLLAEARARGLAGKYPSGLELANEALQLSEQTGYLPIIAKNSLVVGQLNERMMSVEPAVAMYHKALYAAAASGHERVEAEALIGMLSVMGMHLNEPEEALHYGRYAAAVVDRLGAPPDLVATIALYRGNTHMIATQLEQAHEQLRHAVELSDGLAGGERIHLAALNNIAAVLGQQGHYREAADAFAEATQKAEARLGPWHPVVGNHHNNLGVTYSRLGEPDQAMKSLTRALEIYDKVYSSDHPESGRVYHNLGVAHSELGDPQASYQNYRKALEIKTRTLGRDHSSVALSSNNVGDALLQLGRPLEAIPYIEEAIRVWKKGHGEDGPQQLYGLVSLSEAYLAIEQPDKALAPVMKALELTEKGQLDPVEIARAQFVAAQAMWPTGGDRQTAMQYARKARTGYEQSDRPSSKELAKIDAWLAERE